MHQASSIQNFGVTCESITVGHNPSKLVLTEKNLFLPRQRALFFSEHIVAQDNKRQSGGSMSASALMGALTGLQGADVDDDDNGINDIFDLLIAEEEAKRKAAPPPKKFSKAQLAAEEELPAHDPSVYRKIEPLRGPFIGSWMAWDERYRGLDNQVPAVDG